MRWVALFAVLANMLLAVWYFVIIKPAAVSPDGAEPASALVMQPGLPEVSLLAEMDEAEKVARGVRPLSQPVAPSNQPAQCLLVGPVPEKVTALQLKNRFEALGLDPDFRVFQVKLAPVYWVYLPPYPSRDAAQKTLEKLRSAGLDSFYIANGEMAGGISLGMFSQESAANTIRDERAAQGYPALIKVVPKSRPEIWAAFRDPGGLADAGYWRELAVDFPGLGRRAVSCGAVVSADQLF
ncbi:MAG: SPOR domain-containing protein [Gammaproteobacteria bacterium]|nr:MAG: SPOR domain-containing protein [Gammaproteobacteria bacterium]